MTDPREDVVRTAVVRSLLRPLPLVLGFLSMWAISTAGGLLPVLLAGVSAYLGAVVASLFVDPSVKRLPARSAGQLPAGQEARRTKPLPRELRERYQKVHGAVSEALFLLPRLQEELPVEPGSLSEVPEEFRKLARLLARTGEDAPERPALEARLERVEESVLRLRSSLARLVRAEVAEDEQVEELEGAADHLEALADMTSRGLPE